MDALPALRDRMMPDSDSCRELVGVEFDSFFLGFGNAVSRNGVHTFSRVDAMNLIMEFSDRL
jgi:hypothetical protein